MTERKPETVEEFKSKPEWFTDRIVDAMKQADEWAAASFEDLQERRKELFDNITAESAYVAANARLYQVAYARHEAASAVQHLENAARSAREGMDTSFVGLVQIGMKLAEAVQAYYDANYTYKSVSDAYA